MYLGHKELGAESRHPVCPPLIALRVACGATRARFWPTRSGTRCRGWPKPGGR
jgi:hypothetical protein